MAIYRGMLLVGAAVIMGHLQRRCEPCHTPYKEREGTGFIQTSRSYFLVIQDDLEFIKTAIRYALAHSHRNVYIHAYATVCSLHSMP